MNQLTTSSDGTVVSYDSTGHGPAVIVIPGVLSTAADYAAFAAALGSSHTVHTIERRGPGSSGPQGNDYGITKECEDIAAVQKATNAAFLFGHSYGGLIALEAARHNTAFTRLAVYEPGVSVGGSIPTAWMPAYERCLAERQHLDALVGFSIGAGPQPAQRTPHWLMKLMLPLFVRGPERRQMFELLPANLLEHKEVARLDNSYANYAQITAGVLLMFGGKSRLNWLAPSIKALSETLPSSELREFPVLDHFGPDKGAPREVANATAEYFAR